MPSLQQVLAMIVDKSICHRTMKKILRYQELTRLKYLSKGPDTDELTKVMKSQLYKLSLPLKNKVAFIGLYRFQV